MNKSSHELHDTENIYDLHALFKLRVTRTKDDQQQVQPQQKTLDSRPFSRGNALLTSLMRICSSGQHLDNCAALAIALETFTLKESFTDTPHEDCQYIINMEKNSATVAVSKRMYWLPRI